MQIVELRADNFARLKAIEIRPDGSVVPITGRNSQGKTSVLRAIWAVIEGKTAAPAVAIHGEAEQASLYVDLGDYRITRTIKRDPEGREEWSLKVIARDGTRITKTPQALIDSFKGDMGFDPLGWCRLPSKDQAEALRSLVKGFDFDIAATTRSDAFAERTTANRKAKEAQAAADKVQLPEGPEPKAVNLRDMVDELADAHNHNAQVERETASRARTQKQIDDNLDQAERLRAQAATLEQAAEKMQWSLDTMAPIPKPIDTAALQERMGQAQQVEAVRGLFGRRRQFEAEAKTANEDSARLTGIIEDLDAAQHEAIAKAKLPVKGLALGENAVLLNGLPLAQAGTAEKIEVALAIAMAKNPELKVILIDEGSELDSDAMEFVASLAKKNGFQVWIAKIDETRQVGFVIEDGRVAT